MSVFNARAKSPPLVLPLSEGFGLSRLTQPIKNFCSIACGCIKLADDCFEFSARPLHIRDLASDCSLIDKKLRTILRCCWVGVKQCISLFHLLTELVTEILKIRFRYLRE